MLADEFRSFSIFDGLTGDQLAELVAGGTEVRVEPGVELFREGEHADYWWVLVEGAVDLVRHIGREDTVVGKMDVPGRWAGGFRAWDEQGVYLATGTGATAGRVLRVPAQVLRERLNDWFPFGRHLIEGLYHSARSIESTARQRASLITLGTLAAGLAHEINNPAAAASRAVDDLKAACAPLPRASGTVRCASADAVGAALVVARPRTGAWGSFSLLCEIGLPADEHGQARSLHFGRA